MSCILTSRKYKPGNSEFFTFFIAFFSSFVWTMNQKFRIKSMGQLMLKKHSVGFRKWQCQDKLENPSNGTIIFAIFSLPVPQDSQRLLWGIMEDIHWGQWYPWYWQEWGINFCQNYKMDWQLLLMINFKVIARKSALEKTQLSDVLITDNLFW